MDQHSCEVSRRDFIRTGSAITVAAAGLSAVPAFAAEEKEGAQPALPMRELGKRTGLKVTILDQGCGMQLSNRLLNTSWAEGVRIFDTADCYDDGKSEQVLGGWLKETGRRKDVVIVTKDHPKSPEDWMEKLDRRLAALQTDYIDIYFIHGLGDPGRWGTEGGPDIPKSKAWAAAVEKMKKAGKLKHAGFSCHCDMDLRIQLLDAAAEGWPEVIMIAQNPSVIRENKAFNKALDKCHKAGIGLISMKEMRGADTIPNVIPEFEKMGLNKYAAVLSAVWSDERFASICSSMQNVKIIRENAGTARNFKPLPAEKISLITDLIKQYNQAFCHGCTGECCKAAGKEVAFSNIARYLNYYEADGDREGARRLYQALPAELRDWRGADLKAASNACVSRLPFEEILKRAGEKLA
jgi:predicted aldo/keto reductase-like oxidoreductase